MTKVARPIAAVGPLPGADGMPVGSEGPDEVIRVVFKAELEADEEPVGRIVIVRRSALREGSATPLPGRPNRGACVCRDPEGDPGEPCRRCGRDNERWVGLIEAEEIARRHGAPLVEV